MPSVASTCFQPSDMAGELPRIRCPPLAIQGADDEYGTVEQICGIVRAAPQAQLLELPACGRSPHRDQPEAVIVGVLGRALLGWRVVTAKALTVPPWIWPRAEGRFSNACQAADWAWASRVAASLTSNLPGPSLFSVFTTPSCNNIE